MEESTRRPSAVRQTASVLSAANRGIADIMKLNAQTRRGRRWL